MQNRIKKPPRKEEFPNPEVLIDSARGNRRNNTPMLAAILVAQSPVVEVGPVVVVEVVGPVLVEVKPPFSRTPTTFLIGGRLFHYLFDSESFFDFWRGVLDSGGFTPSKSLARLNHYDLIRRARRNHYWRVFVARAVSFSFFLFLFFLKNRFYVLFESRVTVTTTTTTTTTTNSNIE